MILVNTKNPWTKRFMNNVMVQAVFKMPENNWKIKPVWTAFATKSDRGRYIASALRAWRTNPVIGIGPGQHAIRYGEFAATEDGDRELHRWPTQTNHDYYVYEVHSDWVQLLEEYGIIGISLFMIPLIALFVALVFSQNAGFAPPQEGMSLCTSFEKALPAAAMLSVIVTMIHSLGEFGLQIPGITWTLAILVGCGLLATRPEQDL